MGVGIFLRLGGRRIKRLSAPCMIGENFWGAPQMLKGPSGDCGKLPGICWLQKGQPIGTNSIYFKRPVAQTK